MTIIEPINSLAEQSQKLEALQQSLAQTQLMNDETAKSFIFDLKDYLDSLKIVTELIPQNTVSKSVEVSDLSVMLAEQQRELQALISELQLIEKQESKDFFGKNSGEVRRTLGALRGIAELNGLLLQDNLVFQRILKETGELHQVKPVDQEEKSGFFQRLFGKR